MERRPKMLKDFLMEESNSNSCSSSGLNSYPRRVDGQHHRQYYSVRNLIQMDIENARETSKGLQRSRSKAASATVSAFQALINSVKSIQFIAVKSPSILPRSLSRRLSKKNIYHPQNYNTSATTTSNEVKMITTVQIKDIIRWKSFRDLVEEKSQSQPSHHDLDHHLPSSPDHHTTTSRSSNCSSWCDSDFTSEYENDVELGKKYLPFVGRDPLEATTDSPTMGPKDDLTCEEKEQYSPILVLDYDDRFEENSLSSFNGTLANVERTKQKLMQNIRRFESLANLDEWMSMADSDGCEEGNDSDYDEEEKAKLLLNHVKATSLMNNCNKDKILEQMLLAFFVEELSAKRKQLRNDEADCDQMIRLAKTWINGEQRGTMGLEECVREMDRKEKWSKFEEEQEETGLQIENGLLNLLLDELLADLLLG